MVLLRNAICEISKFKNCNRRNEMGWVKVKVRKARSSSRNNTVRDS